MEELQKFINKILFIKRKSLVEFQGVKFYPSEIHLMLVIKDNTATNATRIAEQLAVTKGAVSQTLTRLEKKGVLTKSKDRFKKNELTLTFTPFGAKALKHYRNTTADLISRHDKIIKSFTMKERAVIQRFLTRLGQTLDEIE